MLQRISAYPNVICITLFAWLFDNGNNTQFSLAFNIITLSDCLWKRNVFELYFLFSYVVITFSTSLQYVKCRPMFNDIYMLLLFFYFFIQSMNNEIIWVLPILWQDEVILTSSNHVFYGKFVIEDAVPENYFWQLEAIVIFSGSFCL